MKCELRFTLNRLCVTCMTKNVMKKAIIDVFNESEMVGLVSIAKNNVEIANGEMN